MSRKPLTPSCRERAECHINKSPEPDLCRVDDEEAEDCRHHQAHAAKSLPVKPTVSAEIGDCPGEEHQSDRVHQHCDGNHGGSEY